MGKFEGQENNQELSPEEKLENFRDEVAGLKEAEMQKKSEWEERGRKGEAYNPHFDIISPEFLSKAEMGIYDKFKTAELNNEGFGSLRTEALSRFSGKDVEVDPEYKSNHAFLMYLGNIVNARELRRQMDELRKKK